MEKEKVHIAGKDDFEKKLINDSVTSLRKKTITAVYCFSKFQVDNVVELYGKPLIVKQVDTSIWEITKVKE